ncbi:MAG: hypothetical protein GXP24_13645 [Planctomycetes bacterium]|nr:hypothetical protein [Planctomycetota bacterium]
MTPDVRPLITKLTLARRRRFRFAKLQLPLRLRRLLSRLNAPIKPRFSLRNFFIFTTLVICFFGWVAKERNQSKFERQLGAKLQEQGNRVRFLGLYHSLELSKRFMPQGEWRDLARQFLGERISTITYAGYLENLVLQAF